jgi:hypothetical protein
MADPASPPRWSVAPYSRPLAVAARRACLLLSLLLSRAASADSDGHFCTADGYLAWELREWSAPEKKHVLKVVFVGGDEGISEPRTVALEDFQLHGMRCDGKKIVLLGWDRAYTLELAGRVLPRIASVESRPAGPVPKEDRVNSLTGTRRSRTLVIPSADPARRYELRIEYRETRAREPGGAIRHETTSTLVETDPAGKVLREKVVLTGVAEETID